MILLGFDVETAGDKPAYALQPFRTLEGAALIRAASIWFNGQAAGTLNPGKEYLRAILKAAQAKDAYVTGWNVAFDAAWLIAAGLEAEVFACKWLDAMLLWRHLVIQPENEDTPKDKRKSYALKAAVLEFYPDEAEFKDFEDFQATDEASLRRLLHRNKKDAEVTVRLAEKFWSGLTPKQRQVALIEARCIPLVAKTFVSGLAMDRQAAQDLDGKLLQSAEDLDAQLKTLCPEAAGINFGSSQQLQTLLYKTWGLPADRFSKKTGKPSTDKFALFDLALLDPRAKMLKELREAKNNRVKYAQGSLNSIAYNGDGQSRPFARIFGTYTSRMTYSSGVKSIEHVEKTTKAKGLHLVERKVELPTGIALHQWKRGKEYRKIIQAPEGYTLCEFDFAGQEFRWMAVASNDPTMLSLCAPGEDAHGYMGAQIAREDYRELIRRVKAEESDALNSRKLGKFSNLSFQYRVSARTATVKARVDYELDVDEGFIQQILATYKQSYPGVPLYWTNQIFKCRQLGYAETFAGRRVQLVGTWAGRDAWPMESTAINYPIQGTGGDQKYLALAVARNLLPKFDGHFYFELHDGLFFIFPNDKALSAAAAFKKVLSNLPYKQAWGLDLPIAFPVDAKIGPSWGDLKELKE